MADRPHTFPNLDWETRNTIAALSKQETERAEAAEARAQEWAAVAEEALTVEKALRENLRAAEARVAELEAALRGIVAETSERWTHKVARTALEKKGDGAR